MTSAESIRDIQRQIRVYVTLVESGSESAYTTDIVYTSSRIVVLPTDDREVFAGRGVGIGGTLVADALELYQRATKDRKLDVPMLERLVANDLAIVVEPARVRECSIQKWKKDWFQYLMMEDTESRMQFNGSFMVFGKEAPAKVSWTVIATPTAAKKRIEDRLPVRATIVQEAL